MVIRKYIRENYTQKRSIEKWKLETQQSIFNKSYASYDERMDTLSDFMQNVVFWAGDLEYNADDLIPKKKR